MAFLFLDGTVADRLPCLSVAGAIKALKPLQLQWFPVMQMSTVLQPFGPRVFGLVSMGSIEQGPAVAKAGEKLVKALKKESKMATIIPNGD